MMLNKDQAIDLLKKHTPNQNLQRHCLAVGITMKALAEKLNGDPEMWEVLGIIHDSDWQETTSTPEKHTIITLERLTEMGIVEGPLVQALKSHNRKFTQLAELEGSMEWALECCDELTGFIVAVTLIQPTKKIADVTTASVLKKLSQKSFAAAVDREQIAQCEEKLKIKLEVFIELTLTAMQGISEEIGL